MNIDFNRYEIFRNEDGTTDQLPFVNLPQNASDKYEEFKLGSTRFDKLAIKYYDNVFYEFLILLANPEYLSEFDIEDGDIIRIPFPLDKVKSDYNNILKRIRNR